VVSAREANVFACVVDTVVAPGGGLPPLARTDALTYLDRLLDASPRLTRAGIRAALHALEVGPRLLGYGKRMRQLTPAERLDYLDRISRSPAALALQGVEVMAKLAYYGDDGVMRSLGYDPDAVVARAREVRLAEARW
jgi:hypothetical protein